MIKCEECGEEFSYGRKINCCNSIYFGMIFSSIKNEHKWNCKPNKIKCNTIELCTRENRETLFVDDEKPVYYNWNCENSIRFKYQENMEMRDYNILYE